MKIGMLWFNSDPEKTVAEKVAEAAEYYLDKYKTEANCCCVHPSMIPEEGVTVDGIAIKTSKKVIPNHFWMGKINGQ